MRRRVVGALRNNQSVLAERKSNSERLPSVCPWGANRCLTNQRLWPTDAVWWRRRSALLDEKKNSFFPPVARRHRGLVARKAGKTGSRRSLLHQRAEFDVHVMGLQTVPPAKVVKKTVRPQESSDSLSDTASEINEWQKEKRIASTLLELWGRQTKGRRLYRWPSLVFYSIFRWTWGLLCFQNILWQPKVWPCFYNQDYMIRKKEKSN